MALWEASPGFPYLTPKHHEKINHPSCRNALGGKLPVWKPLLVMNPVPVSQCGYEMDFPVVLPVPYIVSAFLPFHP